MIRKELVCVICNLLLVHRRSSQSLHWKEVDHATSQLFLNPENEEKCLRSGHELSEKVLLLWQGRPPHSCPPSVPPASASSPPPEIWFVLRRNVSDFSSVSPLSPPPFLLISSYLTLCRYLPISPLKPSTYLYKLFREWIRSYFLSPIGLMCLYRVGFQGGCAALNQTLLHTLS